MEFKKVITHRTAEQKSELHVTEYHRALVVRVSAPIPYSFEESISVFRLTVDEEEELRRILNARHIKRIQDTLPGE